jgi:DNA-binding PadR family transcriptional regulator
MPTRLNHLEFLTLLALARLGDEANAGSVRADIAKTGGRRASVAGVYAALDRLVSLRLARSWLADPRPEPGGRARRHYHVTPSGLAWLQREHQRTTALWRGVPTAGR